VLPAKAPSRALRSAGGHSLLISLFKLRKDVVINASAQREHWLRNVLPQLLHGVSLSRAAADPRNQFTTLLLHYSFVTDLVPLLTMVPHRPRLYCVLSLRCGILAPACTPEALWAEPETQES